MNRKSFNLFIISILTLITLPVVAQESTTIFEDNFDDNAKGWAESSFEEGEFKIKNGQYYFTHKRSRGAWTTCNFLNLDDSTDFSIEAKIKTIKGVPLWTFGLVWGRDNNGNSYEFMINKDGDYQIQASKNYVIKSITYEKWNPNFAIKKGNGASNTLKIEKKGKLLNFYINKTKVDEIDYPKLYGNQLGFKINRNQKIAVDYLKVTQN